jgi:RNA polymerase sigma factor (sigma-70 family)
MELTVRDGFETPKPGQDEGTVTRISKMLVRLASKRVKSREAREDLVSDAFAKAWQTYGTRLFEMTDGECWRLLATIVRSAAIDAYYRDERWPEARERLDFLPGAECQPDAAQAVEASDTLAQALRLLEMRERLVFELKHMGFTFREIAGLLGIKSLSRIYEMWKGADDKVSAFLRSL